MRSFLTALSSLELPLSGTSKTELNHMHSFVNVNVFEPTSVYYAVVLL